MSELASESSNSATQLPISRFGHRELEEMPDDLRERIAAVAEKSGFVPNVFRALARRPASDLLELESGALIPLAFHVGHGDGRVVVDPPPGLLDL